jgi:hypothetical protein
VSFAEKLRDLLLKLRMVGGVLQAKQNIANGLAVLGLFFLKCFKHLPHNFVIGEHRKPSLSLLGYSR